MHRAPHLELSKVNACRHYGMHFRQQPCKLLELDSCYFEAIGVTGQGAGLILSVKARCCIDPAHTVSGVI